MKTMFRRLVVFPYTFVLMNWAPIAGLFYFKRGAAGIWDSARARN